MNNDVNDPLVSSTYRDTATERAPDALNQAVLREAGKQAGNRYSKSVFWLRPLAWAASVSLCLAIVLELNSVAPNMDIPAADRTVPASAPAERDELAETEAFADEEVRIDGRANQETASPSRSMLNNMPQLEKSEIRDDDTVAAREEAKGDVAVDLAAAATAGEPAPIEQAESLARMREGDNKSTEIRSFSAGAAPALESALSNACPADQRETPESWLNCIEGLETDGLSDAAAREREALLKAFPDVEMP